MKEITAYKCEDGVVFSDRNTAINHEFHIRRKKAIEEFWDRYGYSGMTADDAACLCLNNIAELENALSGGLS